MDTTTTLKRRRPHLYGDDSYDLYSQTSLTLPSDTLSASYTSDERYVLHQAESILQLPQGELFCFTPQYHNTYILETAASILQSNPQYLAQAAYQRLHPKRQRNAFEFSSSNMPPNYIEDVSEHDTERFERPASLVPSSHVQDPRQALFQLSLADSGSFLASTASGMVDCLAGLATCQGSPKQESSSEYEAMMTRSAAAVAVPPESRQYTTGRPDAGVDGPGNLVQVSEPYSDGYGAPQVENWLADDGTESAQYMQSYPALQPTAMPPTTMPAGSKLTRVQPSTRAENMYYPNGQPSSTCPKLEDNERGEPMTAIVARHPPLLSASSQEPKLQYEPAQGPLRDVVYTRGPLSLTTTSYQHPVMQSVVTPGGGHVPVSSDGPLCSSAGVFPAGPATPSTAVGAHYTLYAGAERPQHHHHHHVLHQMPVATYVGGATVEIPERSHHRPPAARRGPFKDQASRAETAETRKMGSCVRCKMQRIRCKFDEDNLKGQCLGCAKSTSRSWQVPCLRLKINDIVLAKTTQVEGFEWTLRWKDKTAFNVSNWASSEVRIVRVSEGYTSEYVELRVRKFVPQDGDSLTRSWVTPDGQKRSVQIPPYAVIETEAIGSLYNAYIKRGLVSCCRNVLSAHQDTLIWPTYCKALQLGYTPGLVSEKEQAVLKVVMELWMTARLTSRSFQIVGDETLDMPKDILDATSPSYGTVPVPPVMGAQLDFVLIHQIQHNLRRKALESLWDVINTSRAKAWITIYLSTFILLHNAALIIRHDASYARKHGINRRFARVDKVQQYYAGAITLLAYFHYCNKGAFPFSKAAKDADIRNTAKLDDDGMQFVRDTRKAAIDNQEQWQRLLDTDAYEDDFYFVCQMYDEHWLPRAMNI